MTETGANIFARFGVDQDSVPDQRGVRSWPFEPYLELHHQDAVEVLSAVLGDLSDRRTQGLQPKVNPTRQGNFVNCLRVILLNLMRACRVDAKLAVGISSSKGFIAGGETIPAPLHDGALSPDVPAALASSEVVEFPAASAVERGVAIEVYGQGGVCRLQPVAEGTADDQVQHEPRRAA